MFISAKEAGMIIGADRTLVTKWCRAGRFKTAQLLDNGWILDKEEAQTFALVPRRRGAPTGNENHKGRKTVSNKA